MGCLGTDFVTGFHSKLTGPNFRYLRICLLFLPNLEIFSGFGAFAEDVHLRSLFLFQVYDFEKLLCSAVSLLFHSRRCLDLRMYFDNF